MIEISFCARGTGLPRNPTALSQPPTAIAADITPFGQAERGPIEALRPQGRTTSLGWTSPVEAAGPEVGWSYCVGSIGFKWSPRKSCGGLAYGMAQPATGCTHICSRVMFRVGTERGRVDATGRAREHDHRLVVGSLFELPVRECEG